MIRLLQGDVGSGKTIVALMAMADVVEAGRQAALMAPTEILARQHFERMQPLAAAAGLRLALFTGRDTAARRERARGAGGGRNRHCGRHACVVPGERRIPRSRPRGRRRAAPLRRASAPRAAGKGEAADLLVMTATPIPRTLVLTYFGDMDVSALDEKPPGRTPIDTRVIPLERLDEVVAGDRPRDRRRARAPIGSVRWSRRARTLDVAAAEERAEACAHSSAMLVGLVHGRMKGPEKDAAMERFQRGETKVLVATTVIEVGVDVPEATIMVIEHAERFGLAQLHQLRGRVGAARAARPACCSTRARSARPRARAWRSCAKPRTVSASPRKICGCAEETRRFRQFPSTFALNITACALVER